MSKNKKVPDVKIPRQKDEILKVYAELRLKLADAEYLSYVYSKDAETYLRAMIELNQEAAARDQLDAQAKAEKEKEAQNV